MLPNIVSFIKSLLPSLNKSDLESDLEISLDYISTIQDSYAKLEEVQKVITFSSEAVKELEKEFYKEFSTVKHKVKLSPFKKLSTDTLILFKNVKINGDYVLKDIFKSLNDVVVSQSLTAYKANLIRLVGHYFFITRYALDLINFIYTEEIKNSELDTNADYNLNKKQIEFIKKNMWIYARLLAVYGDDHENFKLKLSSIEEINIPKDKIEEAIDAYDSYKIDIFNNLPNGFIGSPIYSVRLIFATWEANRYRMLKDKRKLLELRKLHLEVVKDKGQNDIGLEKEIAYLQKRLTNIDKQIADIESDVE
jgi:hypothetical protein